MNRMAVMEGVIQAAQLIGLPLAGLIFSQAKKFNFGFLPNFGLSALLSFAALVYLIFFVNESVAVREDSSDKWRRLVDLTHPKQVWRSCVQPRPENGRLVIFLCAFVLGTFIMILEGEAQIAFLFVRLQFGWNLEWFTIVSAILLFLLVLGLSVFWLFFAFGTFFFRYFCWKLDPAEIIQCFGCVPSCFGIYRGNC